MESSLWMWGHSKHVTVTIFSLEESSHQNSTHGSLVPGTTSCDWDYKRISFCLCSYPDQAVAFVMAAQTKQNISDFVFLFFSLIATILEMYDFNPLKTHLHIPFLG